MITFIKAQGSSIIATLVDFVTTILLVELFGMWSLLGNAIGVVSGGVTNFLINRDWVFKGAEDKSRVQAFRYFIVWCGNIILNVAGVYFATRSGLNYVVAKVVVSLLVGWGYNYQLQKNYVFKKVDYVS